MFGRRIAGPISVDGVIQPIHERAAIARLGPMFFVKICESCAASTTTNRALPARLCEPSRARPKRGFLGQKKQKPRQAAAFVKYWVGSLRYWIRRRSEADRDAISSQIFGRATATTGASAGRNTTITPLLLELVPRLRRSPKRLPIARPLTSRITAPSLACSS